MRFLSLALVALGLMVSAVRAETLVSGMRLGTHPDQVTRFVLDLDRDLTFSTALAANPREVVLTLENARWQAIKSLAKPVGAVNGMSVTTLADGKVRVGLRLARPAIVKSAFALSPRQDFGWRLVIDIKSVDGVTFDKAVRQGGKRVVASQPAVPNQTAAKPAPVTASQPAPSVGQGARALPPPNPDDRSIVLNSPLVAPQPAPAPQALQAASSQQVQTQQVQVQQVQAPQASAQQSPTQTQVPPTQSSAPAPAVTADKAPTIADFISLEALPVLGKDGAVMSAPLPPPIRADEIPAPAQTAVSGASVVPSTNVAAVLPLPIIPEPRPRSAKMVVVIDAGHGGNDPGAIGVSGIYEKHITLATARELRGILQKTGKYEVHLTRERDVFLRLRERTALARQVGADLFISLHADSLKNRTARGLSVYTLSQNASDSEAQALAENENKADLISGIDLSHESQDVANILIDLAQRETMNASAIFAAQVVGELGKVAPLLSNTHRFAGFAVLKAPDVPSVLIELGYLSNADEERLLRKSEYRSKLAQGIAKAIDRYFQNVQKAWVP